MCGRQLAEVAAFDPFDRSAPEAQTGGSGDSVRCHPSGKDVSNPSTNPKSS